MVGITVRATLLIFAALTTVNCAGNYTTSGAAVAYNRSFADARNEVILLNILRASAGEPLQFSAITGVQGGAHNSTSIRIPFTNVIAGGDDTISPEITIGPRNPNTSVAPLEGREFVTGMLRSLSVETIDNLITQGFDRETVLSLAIGGIQCRPLVEGQENVQMNFGPPDDLDQQIRRSLQQSQNYTAATTRRLIRHVRLPLAEALKLLREGAGAGRDISPRTELPAGLAAPANDEMDLTITSVASSVEGVAFKDRIPKCSPMLVRDEDGELRETWGLIPRSVHSIFRYLGRQHLSNSGEGAGTSESTRAGGATAELPASLPPLITIHSAPNGIGAPVSAAISTSFRGRIYYVSRADAGTLEAISIIAALIALQTSESSLAASRPIIAIPAQ